MKYPPQSIVVEYDSRSHRVQKVFIDHYLARRFYASKLKAGKHPTVLKQRDGTR
jgi:hypothetical protein